MTFEQRQRLRELRSEIVRARYERERRIAAREAQSETERRRALGCSGCGADLDACTAGCDTCKDRHWGKRRRQTEAYREAERERWRRKRREAGMQDRAVCKSCGVRDGATPSCDRCKARMTARLRHRKITQAEYDAYMDARRATYRRPGDRFKGRVWAHT